MPAFDDSAVSAAPVEEVWKLVHDPARFPDWWAGVASVDRETERAFVFRPEGYPDFPIPQRIDESRSEGRVVISCLLSHLRFRFTLEPLDPGDGTRITAHVDIPEEEAARLDDQRAGIRRSLERLAAVAAGSAGAGG